jgi:formyltetrahydrofolate synthetase
MDNVPETVMNAALRNAKIIADVLAFLPVGYLPNHTPESIPDRVKELVTDNGNYYNALERIAAGTKHSKEIAQNAIGYTDNHEQHIELLREENLMLKLKVEELEMKAAQSILTETIKNQTYANEQH